MRDRDGQADTSTLIFFFCFFCKYASIAKRFLFISVLNRFQYSNSWKSAQKGIVLVLNGIEYLLSLSHALRIKMPTDNITKPLRDSFKRVVVG